MDPSAYLSFLIPTRGDSQLVERFLDSVARTTSQPDQLEIVFARDRGTPELPRRSDLRCRHLEVEPGSTMGSLNRACFEASSGRFVMLLNDDVVLRTEGWDERVRSVLERHEDDIAFLHVNDFLFRARLCTFPLVSRRACERIGLCPAEYRRYRIDDHLHDTYGLLGLLGFPRLYYLPEVVFEHDHFTPVSPGGEDAGGFQSADQRVYRPNPTIQEADERVYQDLSQRRREDAVQLALAIDPSGDQEAWLKRLASIHPTRKARQRRLTQRIEWTPYSRPTLSDVSALILVPAGRVPNPSTTRYLESKQIHWETAPWPLEGPAPGTLLDAWTEATASRVIALVRGDVELDGDWLGSMLQRLDPSVGLVASALREPDGQQRFGWHASLDPPGLVANLGAPDGYDPIAVADFDACLIQKSRCGYIRWDGAMNFPSLGFDFCAKVWEQGFRVLCQPDAVAQRTTSSIPLEQAPSDLFAQRWFRSNRWLRLAEEVWTETPGEGDRP